MWRTPLSATMNTAYDVEKCRHATLAHVTPVSLAGVTSKVEHEAPPPLRLEAAAVSLFGVTPRSHTHNSYELTPDTAVWKSAKQTGRASGSPLGPMAYEPPAICTESGTHTLPLGGG